MIPGVLATLHSLILVFYNNKPKKKKRVAQKYPKDPEVRKSQCGVPKLQIAYKS